MARAMSQTLQATQPQIPLTIVQQEKEPASTAEANRNQREYHEWNRRCALELKKHDGLSTGARFFGAAFSLLCDGKKRADLDRVIDGTIDAEKSEENLIFFLQHNLRTCGRRGEARTRAYVANYFEGKEKRNREKRFHDAVLFLLEEGFTREELHKLVMQAEEI
jgi:hypothetical protein